MVNWVKDDEKTQVGKNHPDKEQNLKFCKEYISNSEGKLPKGMRIRIGDSDNEKETIVQIIYRDPEFGSKYPSFAGTVNLNQPHRCGYDTPIICFFEEFRSIYLRIYGIAKKYNTDQTDCF